MKLKKVINNNAIIAEDDLGLEYVLFGRGIAFGILKDSQVPEEKIERKFASIQEKNQLEELIESIPQNYFELTCDIIDYIQQNLKVELSNSIYITLMDHISFLKERASKGLIARNSLKWEICRYYPEEYRLSKKVVQLLEDELEVELNDDEVSSIALHIINAQLGGKNVGEGIKYIRIVDDILQIICYQAQIKPSDENIDYQRLVLHVKFFVQRIRKNKTIDPCDEMYSLVVNNYPKANEIVEKVKDFVEQKYDCKVSNEEVTYLIMHVERLLKSNNHR